MVLNAMSQAGSVRRMNEIFENWTGQGMILCPKKDIWQVQTRCKCSGPPAAIARETWSHHFIKVTNIKTKLRSQLDSKRIQRVIPSIFLCKKTTGSKQTLTQCFPKNGELMLSGSDTGVSLYAQSLCQAKGFLPSSAILPRECFFPGGIKWTTGRGGVRTSK